jgi:serine phosphatase RsbU (regulator of sigma subunit)
VNVRLLGGVPWVTAFFLALPAMALAAAGGLLGLRSGIGIGLVAAAAAYLLVDLTVLQPALARTFSATLGRADPARQFLQRAMSVRSVEEIAHEFRYAVEEEVGEARALLIVPAEEGGGVRVLGSGMEEELSGDATEAFVWLSDRIDPIDREELLVLARFEGASAALSLLDKLGCDVLLPLRHRGLLLGLALIGRGGRPTTTALLSFYKSMRAYTTAAMANQYLDAETRGRSGLTKTFDLATAMQEALMPDEKPVRRPGIELRGLFRPVAECGGDLWTWREIEGGNVLVLIGDATGHGAAPALLAAVAKGALEAYWQLAGAYVDPAALLSVMNRSIYRTGRTRYLMTAFAAVIDRAAGEVRFANAGQNFPYLISLPGGKPKLETLLARGNTLGAAREARYELHKRPLKAGDKILFYTDGVIDAGSPAAEPFGDKRMRAAISALAGERATRIPELLSQELERFLQGREPSDDITMVAVELTADAGARE